MASHSHVLVVIYIYIIPWPLTNRHLLGVASHLLSLWCNRIQLIQQHKRHHKYSHLSTHELDESNNNNNNRNISSFPSFTSFFLTHFIPVSGTAKLNKKKTPPKQHPNTKVLRRYLFGPPDQTKITTKHEKPSKPQEVDIFGCLA